MNGRTHGAADAVLYGADGSRESAAMVELLTEMGVEFEYRSVNRDPAARREWEDLDAGEIIKIRIDAGRGAAACSAGANGAQVIAVR